MPIARAKRQTPRLLFLLVQLCLLSQASALAAPQKPDAKKLFAYDPAVALDLKETATTEQDGAVIKDLNYAAYAPSHGRIKAYLVKPKGNGPFAGVVYFHWLGRPKG